MKTEKLLLTVLLFAILCSLPLAQTPSKGVISGRVVSDEGAPLMGITVRLSPPNASNWRDFHSASTDDEGNFRFNNLSPRAYAIEAQAGRGFVPTPKTAAERAEPSVVRIGESVTLTMIRGGVITGRVTNSNNENLIAMPLAAIMVRDTEGNPVGTQAPFSPQAATDDRGIYRFFGLTPGTYIVLANSGNPYFGSQASLYDNEAPTYYPSSTRDTAADIRVTSGGEAIGIDIRYRGERGHAISGKIIGAKDSVTVELLHVASESPQASGYVGTAETGFDFYGVPDGEYELVAQHGGDTPMAISPRRVSVRGTDITGLELRLTPLASMAGTVVIESSPNACDKARSMLEEMLITARPDVKPRAETDPITRANSPETAINAKGEFELRSLSAVRYRLALNLPSENLYVKTIAQKTPAADLARNGALLKSGDKLTGVIVTVAEDAASLLGKISTKEGSRLSSRLRVHLIPAETTAADDLLRYSEKIVTGDGAFAFTNLSPGKYLLLARAVPDNEPADRLPAPVAWDSAERAKLRKEAEAAKNEIELKACQRVKDHVLKF